MYFILYDSFFSLLIGIFTGRAELTILQLIVL